MANKQPYELTARTLALSDIFVTQAADGATPVGKNTTQQIKDLIVAPNFVKATLTSAQILDLYANPVEILPAQGANKLIIASTVFINYFFGTTAYITNTSLSLVGSGVQAYTMTSALGQGTDYALQYIITGNGGNSAGLAAFTNLPLELTTLVGNPAAGDGTLDIYVTYQIITL